MSQRKNHPRQRMRGPTGQESHNEHQSTPLHLITTLFHEGPVEIENPR